MNAPFAAAGLASIHLAEGVWNGYAGKGGSGGDHAERDGDRGTGRLDDR